MDKIKKGIFDCNVVTSKLDGDEFVVEKISEDLSSSIDTLLKEIQDVEKKASASCLAQIIESLAALTAGILITASLKSCAEGISFKQQYENIPVFTYIIWGALIIWAIMFAYRIFKSRKVWKSVDADMLKHRIDTVDKRVRAELSIPDDAKHVDVFSQCYEEKNGKRLVKNPGLFFFLNQNTYVWRKDNMLCFSDNKEAFAIPVERIGKAELIKTTTQISGWNKQEPLTDKKYKQFKVYENNNGVFIKQFYAIPVQTMSEEMVIRIPDYDYETVEKYIKGEHSYV